MKPFFSCIRFRIVWVLLLGGVVFRPAQAQKYTTLQPLQPGYAGEEQRGVAYYRGDARERFRAEIRVDNGIPRIYVREFPYRADRPKYVRLETTGLYDNQGQLTNRAIFVMDPDGNLYIHTGKGPDVVHHSSLLAGEPVAAAGTIEVVDGIVVAVDNNSGHYKPKEVHLNQAVDEFADLGFLRETIRAETVPETRQESPSPPRPPTDPAPRPPPERTHRQAPEWDEARPGSDRSAAEAPLPPAPDPPPPPPRTDPPSPDAVDAIKRLILETDAANMDVDFMKRVYAEHPDAPKIIGQIMGDPVHPLPEKNTRMGDLRSQMDLAVWKELLKEHNIRVEFTNQGKMNGIRSDLDYTLYYIAEEAGVSIERMIELHREKWQSMYDGLTPERVEIAVMNGEAFYPDWRSESLSAAQHEVAIKRNLRLLRQNPEAYFVPGANKQQVHNRALRDGVTTVLTYDATTDGLTIETGPARDIALRYQGVHPQYDYKNALGNLIQNPREFLHHGGDNAQEAIRRAKYFNRVVNEGLGNLAFFANTYQEIARATTLTPAQKTAMQRQYLKRAFHHLDLSDAVLDEFQRVIDISMEIELDKVESRANYVDRRADYFRDYRAQAEALIDQKNAGRVLDSAAREALVLAEQQKLFENHQKRVMAQAMLAGLEHAALRDLTPRGAMRNALRFETDPATGRPVAVFDEARVRKVAFERATEVLLLFELINDADDVHLKQLRSDVLSRAPTPELRDLYTKLSRVTSSEIDNFLDDTRGKYGGKVQMAFDEFINRKIERCREAGVDLVDPDAAERQISDTELREHIVQGQLTKLNPAERVTLEHVVEATRTAAGEIGQEMYGKATGLMMGSSAVNLIRAYQIGDEQVLRHAIYTEALNYMPDFVEIPFTLLDALMRAEQGDVSGLYDLGLIGVLRYAPTGVGQVLLLWNITSGTFQIARTYVVTRIDQDLVEQALRSRPRDVDGNPLPNMIRARRNPHKDSEDTFRGDPPLFPIFYQQFPVPEDDLSDYQLYRQAKVIFAGQIAKDVKEEGLEEGTDAWRERADQLAWKYGFDLPYYARMAAMYAHYAPQVRRYVLGTADRPGGEYVEDVAIRKFMVEAVMTWYYAQPDGYRREFQGYFDMFFGDQEKGLLDRLVNAVIAEYRRQEDAENARMAAQEADERERRERLARGATVEKQLLATAQRLRDEIAEGFEAKAVEAGREALAQLEQYEPMVRVSYPWTYTTEDLPPVLNVDVRAPVWVGGRDYALWVEEEQVSAEPGAPAGWQPPADKRDRFEPGADGRPELHPVTVTYRYTVRVFDADSTLVGTDALTVPVVQYVEDPGPFDGRISVTVVGATESGREEDYVPYDGAVVTVGDQVDTTRVYPTGYAAAHFSGLEAGAHAVAARPRDGDERHREAEGAATLVDTLAAPPGTLEGEASVTLRLVLPYVPPPDDQIAEAEEPTAGEGEGGDEAGDAGGGGNEDGGDEDGGDEDGGDEDEDGPTIEEVIQQLGSLTGDAEARRDRAIDECKYEEAYAAQQDVITAAQTFLATTFPTGVPPEVQQVADRLETAGAVLGRAATAERTAKELLRIARSQLLAREVEDALTSLETATQVPDLPSCLRDQIMTLYNDIRADVEGWADRIDEAVRAANESCDYARALALGEAIEREAPTLSWVTEQLPRIRDLERRQREARGLMEQARQREEMARQLVGTDREAARRLLTEAATLATRALEIAPACDADAINQYIAGLGDLAPATEAPRIERSLLLLMDTSGSMGSGGKMDQAKAAATSAVQALSPSVEVALLSYDGGCSGGWRVVQPFTTDRGAVVQAIASLSPGGGTPMAPAVVFAQQYMERDAHSGSGQILLLSDGQNDCGSTQEAGESLRRSTLPVRIDAVGFGLEEGGQAENDLGDLVRASGNGQQYSANSAGELISAFRRAFIADQVKTSDPTLTGPAATRLSELFAAALDYLRANDVRSARMTFEQALAQFPDAPAAHFNASLAYEAEGQVVSAIEHGEAYLRLAPGAGDAALVRERLAYLRAEQRENPRAVYNPNECSNLHRWAQAELRRFSGQADRRALVYSIMNTAQRGDCRSAERAYEQYVQRYGR